MSDYDYEPKSGDSLFLRLKEKGQVATVRLASKPYREPKVWKEGVKAPLAEEETANLTPKQWFAILKDPDYTVNEMFHWVVIDRDDGKAKIFTSTAGVYKSIKEYAQKEAWGDPTKYDFEITRTEQPGRGYYSVAPLPDKGDLDEKSAALVAELDLASKIKNARPLNEEQVDDISEIDDKKKSDDDKPLKKAEAEKVGGGYESATDGKKKETTPTEEIDIEDLDEPIDLSEIPF